MRITLKAMDFIKENQSDFYEPAIGIIQSERTTCVGLKPYFTAVVMDKNLFETHPKYVEYKGDIYIKEKDWNSKDKERENSKDKEKDQLDRNTQSIPIYIEKELADLFSDGVLTTIGNGRMQKLMFYPDEIKSEKSSEKNKK